MKSFSQGKRQQIAMQSGLIDLNSTGQSEFKGLTGDAISVALYNVAADFITTAVDNLNAVDRVGQGALEGSIVPTEIIVMGKVMTININLNDYYKFIDQGVKGWKSGTPNSPFAFKQPQKGGGVRSSKMVTAIKQWIIQEGSKATGKENQHPITKREARRKKITDVDTQAAILITMRIKKKGLKRTLFWTDTSKTIEQRIINEFESALKIDITNSFYGNSSK